MKDTSQTNTSQSSGLPFRNQLFGGFHKTDVTEYIEKLIVSIDTEKKGLDGEKKNVYDLMAKGKTFSERLIDEAREQAAAIVEQARQEAQLELQKADQELQKVKQDIAQLCDERLQILNRCQSDTDQLIHLLTHEYHEVEATYERMLKPLTELSHSLGGNKE